MICKVRISNRPTAETIPVPPGQPAVVSQTRQADGMWFLGQLLQNGLPCLKELDLEHLNLSNASVQWNLVAKLMNWTKLMLGNQCNFAWFEFEAIHQFHVLYLISFCSRPSRLSCSPKHDSTSTTSSTSTRLCASSCGFISLQWQLTESAGDMFPDPIVLKPWKLLHLNQGTLMQAALVQDIWQMHFSQALVLQTAHVDRNKKATYFFKYRS